MRVKAEFQSPVIEPQTIYVKVRTRVVVGLAVVTVVVHCDVAAVAGVAKVNGINKTKIRSKCVNFLFIFVPHNLDYLTTGLSKAPFSGGSQNDWSWMANDHKTANDRWGQLSFHRRICGFQFP